MGNVSTARLLSSLGLAIPVLNDELFLCSIHSLGNLDPKNAMATTYTAVTIAPINDIPYLQNDQSYVTENNLNSDVDEETDVAIGQAMGMTVDDTDGSQYLDVVISGFPTNVIRLYFAEELRSVAASIDKERGTVTLSGGNSTEVLAVLETLVAVLAHDDDRNFNLTIEGTSKDSNGVVEVVDSYSLSHTVIVGAVADTPTLDIGAKVKALVVEGSTANTYPVTIGLNDRDGKQILFQKNACMSIAKHFCAFFRFRNVPGELCVF